MEIRLAKTAGFCFGVNRAVELLYDKVEAGEQGAPLAPLFIMPSWWAIWRRAGSRSLIG